MALFFNKAKDRKWKVGSNELNEIIFNQFVNTNPLIWYNYDKEDYIQKGYISNSDVFTIIRKIIDKASIATPYIYIDDGGVKSRNLKNNKEQVLKHKLKISKGIAKAEVQFAPESLDLVELIKRPNKTQTWNDQSELRRIFHFAQGDQLLYREAGDDNCAISLHVIPSHKAEAVIGKNEDGDYGIIEWRIDIGYKTERTIPAIDVFHMMEANPNYDEKGSQLRGMSKLRAGLKWLQLSDKALEAWIKSAENEGAKGLISPNHANPELWLTPEQRQQVEEKTDEKIHGSKNKNRVVVSSMPLQYTPIGLSPDGLNVSGGLNFAFKKLCDIYGVPYLLFNPDAKYDNLDVANEMFVKGVILPYLNAEENKLNQWLVEPFRIRDGKNYVLDYDLSDYEELRLTSSEVDTYLKLYSKNDVRVMMGGDESEEDGMDMVWVPQNDVPISEASFPIEDL